MTLLTLLHESCYTLCLLLTSCKEPSKGRSYFYDLNKRNTSKLHTILLNVLLLLTADGMKLLALLRMPPPTPGLPGVRCWLSSTCMPGVGSSSLPLVLPGVAAPGVPAGPRTPVAAVCKQNRWQAKGKGVSNQEHAAVTTGGKGAGLGREGCGSTGRDRHV
jgi:hypothetical protein